MNDFVLRGFCKKCNCPLEMDEEGKAFHNYGNDCETVFSQNPIWFLSPQQLDIIIFSKEYENWSVNENTKQYFRTLIAQFLNDEPFLVAKILKESEVK